MKRIFIIALMCVIALLAFGCEKAEVEDNRTEYDITVDFTSEKLVCEQRTTVVNSYKEGLSELVFLLAPNAYSENAVHKAYVKKLPAYGSVTVEEVSVDGEKTSFTIDDDGYYMTVPVPSAQISERRVVDIKYEVSIPECNLRLGKSEGFYNVSGFYPQLAVFSDDEFRKDSFSYVGDPVMSDVADFTVRITVPENMTVACPGNVTETVADGQKTITASERRMRDFAFVASEKYTVKTTEKYGVTVKYFSTGDSDYGALASDVIKVFSDNFCDYPYDTYVLAETPFIADGMEFSGMSFISSDATDKEKAVVHETVHQWFYNIVGSDNVNAPYMDEGITTFMTEYFYLLNGDEGKYKEGMKAIENAYFSYEKLQKMRGEKANLAIDGSIYQYSEYAYSMLVYYKSSLMFKNLFETAGASRFNKAVKGYVADNYFRWSDADSLVGNFNKAMNCDVKGLIDAWVDGSVTTATFS